MMQCNQYNYNGTCSNEKRKLTITFIPSNLKIEGAAKFVVSLAKALIKQKYQVNIISSGGPLLSELEGLDVKHYQLPVDTRSIINILPVARKVSKVIETDGIQIVNPHGFIPTLIAWLATRKVKQVVRIATIHVITRWIYRFIASKLLPFLSDAIIVVSEFEKKRLFGRKSKNIYVIYSGIDLKTFQLSKALDDVRKEFNLSHEDKIVGIVARLSPEKGHKYFLLAASQISQVIPSAKFVIVGGGVLENELKEFANKLNLCSVIFTGQRHDIPELLSIFDVFVLSSLWESLPIAIREAMAMSKPVVATDVGGINEAIHHGETGLLVPPKDSKALSEAIIYLLKNPERALEMGKAGRKMIEENFSIPRWVNQTVNLFQRILEQKYLK